MNSKYIRNFLFTLLVIGFLGYSCQYIQKSSILVGDKTYYVLFDDAMISMRYAYNLAHGPGLVWNPGEYVEGFTNPLWVGLMALVHLFPIPLSHTSLVIQIIGAIFLALNLFFVKKVVEHFTDNLFAMLAAVALTAFYAPLNIWGLLGMEVSVLALIVTVVVWMAITQDVNRFNPRAYILLAVSTLFRIDMAVPFIVLIVVMFFVQKKYRKQHLVWGLGLLIGFLGAQTIARFAYYGDWLPNTYYLKVTGWPFVLRILRGLYTLVWFIYYTNWVLYLIPFAILLFRRDWKINLLLLVLLGQMAYSVYVGGDAWEHHGGANRYIAIAMPLFFVAFAYGIEILRQKAVAGLGGGGIAEFGSRATWIVILVISLINFNLLLGDWRYIERLTFARKLDYVAASEHNVQISLALQNTTKPGASIAVVGAGTIPYFLPEDYVIDILGKADPYIARQVVRAPMSYEDIPNMRPGHMKWDYAYTIGKLKPDVIVSLWEDTGEEATKYMGDYVNATIGEKIKVYLRKDSPNIWWDRVSVNK